jgi:hypothetical protein
MRPVPLTRLGPERRRVREDLSPCGRRCGGARTPARGVTRAGRRGHRKRGAAPALRPSPAIQGLRARCGWDRGSSARQARSDASPRCHRASTDRRRRVLFNARTPPARPASTPPTGHRVHPRSPCPRAAPNATGADLTSRSTRSSSRSAAPCSHCPPTPPSQRARRLHHHRHRGSAPRGLAHSTA